MTDVPPQQPYGSPPNPEGAGTPPPYTPPPPPPGYNPPPPPPPPGYAQQPGYGTPAYGAAPAGQPAWTGPPLADWATRALARLVDFGITAVGVIGIIIVSAILGAISSALGLLVGVIGYLAVLAFAIWQLVVQGQTGQTIGKRVIGVKVLKQDDLSLLGPGLSVGREIVHFVDSVICYVGWLFPLWDPMRQTLADKIMKTVSITVPKQPFSLTPPAAA